MARGRLVARLRPLACGLLLAGCALPVNPPAPAGALACDPPRPQVCTMVYLPVCGYRGAGPGRKTYGNACNACADAAVVAFRPGACGE